MGTLQAISGMGPYAAKTAAADIAKLDHLIKEALGSVEEFKSAIIREAAFVNRTPLRALSAWIRRKRRQTP